MNAEDLLEIQEEAARERHDGGLPLAARCEVSDE